MSFGFGFSLPAYYGALRVGGAWSPSVLFANGEPGVWYDPSDLSTLFQDAAGTTPVTAVEQPVGLMLDKSKGLVLGPELVTNGGPFTATNGWSGINVTLSVENGRLKATSNASGYTSVFFSNASGVFNRVKASYFLQPPTGRAVSVIVRHTFSRIVGQTGFYTDYPVPSGANIESIAFTWTSSAAGEVAYIDNVSVRELPGNHASQPTATSRPVLSARYNLLTKTEQFDDAVWSRYVATVTANATTAPNGTLTADTLTATGSGGSVYVSQPLAGTYTISVYAKAGTSSTIFLAWSLNGNGRAATFTLSGPGTAGVVSTVGTGGVVSGGTSSIISVGNGWYRCVISDLVCGANSGGFIISVPTQNQTVYIWGASLVPADQADLPYQRVNTATDYDSDPAKFKPYLLFDGVDDWLVTNTITPGTDKVQVFAGVRKLSDATNGVVVETGDTYWTVNGVSVQTSVTPTFAGASSPFANYYVAVSDNAGTQVGDFDVFTTQNVYPAPSTNTISAVFDRGAAPLSKTNLRVNGVVPTKVTGTFTGTAVTGNVLNTPLYIGRRAGTSLPFNGHLYGLVVRFGANLSAGQIASAENYMNSKTKAY